MKPNALDAGVGVRGVYAWGNRAEVRSQFPGDEPGDELQGSALGALAQRDRLDLVAVLHHGILLGAIFPKSIIQEQQAGVLEAGTQRPAVRGQARGQGLGSGAGCHRKHALRMEHDSLLVEGVQALTPMGTRQFFSP
jgi:hypothetical protein